MIGKCLGFILRAFQVWCAPLYALPDILKLCMTRRFGQTLDRGQHVHTAAGKKRAQRTEVTAVETETSAVAKDPEAPKPRP